MASEVLQNRFVYIPKTALVFSIALHLVIGAMLVMSAALQFSLPLSDANQDIKKVAESFIQVDVVALPDQLLKDQTALDTSLPMVEEVKKEVAPVAETKAQDDVMRLEENKKIAEEEARKKREADELQKKKIEEKKRQEDQAKALKQLQEEARREAALKALNDAAGKSGRAKLSGNKLSQGTAMSGAIGNAQDKWASRVAQQIKNHFNVFPWQQKKGLRVVIQLELYPTGRLRSRKVVTPSSDRTYDSAALHAADLAQPLDLPEDPQLLSQPLVIELKP